MTSLNRRLFVEMLREEWRLHSELFGGSRFAGFPVFVALLTAGAVSLLTTTGTDITAILAGVHGLALFFGLRTGSTGFVGQDAMRDVLGDVTMLVFSARTLPVSQRRLLSVFLLKDAVYYAVLFLFPIAVGFTPAVVSGDLAALAIPTAWATTTAMFLLGVTITFAAIGLSTRGTSGRLLLLGLAAGAGLAFVSGVDFVRFTPYGLFDGATLPEVVVALAPIPLLAAAGIAVYDTGYERAARTAGRTFPRWQARLPFDADGLTVKTLLDVQRSSGGLGKVLFSGGILFAVSWLLIDLAETITGLEPSTGVSFGAILALSAFTTYNWITMYDDVASYQLYPVSVADVVRAKFRAFLVLGIPTCVGYFLLAVVWQGARLPEAVVGLVLLVGLALYLFGVTVALAGFDPNEFLFDTVLFAGFGVALAVVLVPILIVGLVLAPVSTELLVALGVGGVLVGGIGIALYRRSVPKWERHYRR
ncbi:hypothetical protein [Haloarchaeobius iranensis]|uniref:ABC-2 type transport system permease protein n=1 Tax=Haloarchaeobius iranensis TaxID=996166 RepID=A0A1G9UFP3_9EURY|nr:hypothetical protein [Haloarchaeobius iranensis]SDM58345.1 hypothetical protein SAMN05192554_10486 [Haloarchaeobius iranensis]